MLLQHITIYPSQWAVQLPEVENATGSSMCVNEYKSSLFNDKKYWPGISHT